MSKFILSDRQKPRALELFKAAYAAHVATCPKGDTCEKMVELRAEIEALEAEGVVPTVSCRSDVK